jgi:hypothetical protein
MESCEVWKIGSATVPAWMGLDAELRLASTGLATATLVVLLVCTSREGLAETGSAAGSMRGEAVTLLASASTSMSTALMVEAPSAPLTTKVRRLRELEALLAVRGGLAPVTASETDAAIVAATARGNDASLERPQPFRKKNTDLFRTQRAVHFADQDMQVRLRLRAKSRNAVSVELRF